MPVSVVVLAAGQGKRMRSERPKVLHELGGRGLLGHVLATARALEPAAIHVVYGHGGEMVRNAYPEDDLTWAVQPEQLGTGDAVARALPAIPDDHQVLVLCGDVPLITPRTLRALHAAAADAVGVLTVRLPDATGYGRVLRDAEGEVSGIVEEKDASPAERAIDEVNTGILCLPAGALRRWLAALDRDNAQGELYLTDVIAAARREGVTVRAALAPDPAEVQGVNDRRQLAAAERAWQRRAADALMLEQGVTLADPERFDLRGTITAGPDCRIDVNVLLEGRITLGAGVSIGAHSVLRDCRLDDGARVEPHCVIEGARIGAGAVIGPFARLRPGTELARGARVGNFVETKNARVGEGSKINHLSYIGDADLGSGVNVGAGTITCNYDGVSKHRTHIADNAFIGSNSALVAPVSVGRNATVGAGTVLRDAAPDDSLTLTVTEQKTRPGWRRDRARDDTEGA